MSQPPGTPLKSPWTHRLPALFISSPPDEKQKGLVSGLFVSLQPQSVVAFLKKNSALSIWWRWCSETKQAARNIHKQKCFTALMRCEKKRRWRRSSCGHFAQISCHDLCASRWSFCRFSPDDNPSQCDVYRGTRSQFKPAEGIVWEDG